MTYIPHADKVATHVKYTIKISIALIIETETISYVRDTYIIPTGSTVSGMTIQATTLTGTYAIL